MADGPLPADHGAVRELKVRAVLGEIDRVRSFLREFLHGLALNEEDALRMELALHEICVNISLYAYPQGPGEMAFRIWKDDGSIFLEIRDKGVPFDPSRKPNPDLPAKLLRGEKGGFGIYLFKTLLDGYTYQREKDENVLTVFKKL